jgi:hypothetical protein
MTLDQAEQLARLMEEAWPTRPAGVLTASLEFRDGHGAWSPSGRTARRSTTTSRMPPLPRGTELMQKIGVEPEARTFEILELG